MGFAKAAIDPSALPFMPKPISQTLGAIAPVNLDNPFKAPPVLKTIGGAFGSGGEKSSNKSSDLESLNSDVSVSPKDNTKQTLGGV